MVLELKEYTMTSLGYKSSEHPLNSLNQTCPSPLTINTKLPPPPTLPHQTLPPLLRPPRDFRRPEARRRRRLPSQIHRPSLLPYSFLIPDGQTHPHASSCSSSSSAFRRAQRRTAAVVVRFDHSLCTLCYFFFANLISHFSFILGFSVLLTFGNGRFPAS